jgi:putative restriction endonuclease
MRYWWVNQNQTYREEIRGNFMWSPKVNSNGARNQFYENMREVAPGDIVFSFRDTRIQAVGIATGAAQTAPKPDFGTAGLNWSNEGWFVPVYYCAFDAPIRPKDHIQVLQPFLPSKYSPLRASGDGLQSIYLAEVPGPMADALAALIGQSYYDALALLSAFPTAIDADEIDEIEVAGGVSVTFKEQLTKARRGQGVFRSSVLLNEEYCRVTGVSDPRHLRASHIKPWRDSNNTERLHGSNGLLLSPHVDHLFDKGFISFSNDEQLLIVPDVRNGLLDAWGIDASAKVGTFNSEQRQFLEYHRINIFQGDA